MNGSVVSAISAKAVKWCGLGALITAAYQLTQDFDAAHQLGHEALRPRYGAATLIHVNDTRAMSRYWRCSTKLSQRVSAVLGFA
jgi:hypothetical protein